jgi:energy-coupling factor transport system permease protein
MIRLHPLTALALVFQAALLALLLDRPLNLALLAGLAAAYALTGGGLRWWRWLVLGIVASTWTMTLTQGLFYGGTPRTVWLVLLPPRAFPIGDPPGLYIYGEGLAYGLVQSLRVNAIVLFGAGLLARYSAERLTAGLRAAGVPGPLCFLAAMALRHIPLLLADMRDLWLAQRLRGMRLAGAGVFRVPRLVLLPMLAANLRRSDEIAAALQSRGFSLAAIAQTPRESAPWGQRMVVWVFVAALALLFAAIVFTRLHLAGALSLPALEPLYGWVVDYV